MGKLAWDPASIKLATWAEQLDKCDQPPNQLEGLGGIRWTVLGVQWMELELAGWMGISFLVERPGVG